MAALDLLAEAARLGAAGEAVALATVVRTAGSAPRRPGAQMLVHADGRIVETVGGGRMEHAIVALARAVAAGQEGPVRWRKHLVRDLAMCCGGEMEVFVEPIDGARAAVLARAVAERNRRRTVALRTSMVAPWTKAIVDGPVADGGLRLHGDAFVEIVRPRERLVIFGAGHIAAATAPLARAVGFDVVVCDEDDSLAVPSRFPDVALPGVVHAADVERAVGGFGPGDHLLIVTRDHAVDQTLLEQLLPRTDLAFLGMVGSRGKLGRFKRRLVAKGIGDDAAWARLHSPVGLDIGAQTPEEIAVAIVGQLVAVRAAARNASELASSTAGASVSAPSGSAPARTAPAAG